MYWIANNAYMSSLPRVHVDMKCNLEVMVLKFMTQQKNVRVLVRRMINTPFGKTHVCACVLASKLKPKTCLSKKTKPGGYHM